MAISIENGICPNMVDAFDYPVCIAKCGGACSELAKLAVNEMHDAPDKKEDGVEAEPVAVGKRTLRVCPSDLNQTPMRGDTLLAGQQNFTLNCDPTVCSGPVEVQVIEKRFILFGKEVPRTYYQCPISRETARLSWLQRLVLED